jgi:hypothetical protein
MSSERFGSDSEREEREKILRALIYGLEEKPETRYQSIAIWQKILQVSQTSFLI